MTEKQQKTTTIEISITTYNTIHSVGTKIEQILNEGRKRKKTLSLDKIIQIVFLAKNIDLQISDLMLDKY